MSSKSLTSDLPVVVVTNMAFLQLSILLLLSTACFGQLHAVSKDDGILLLDGPDSALFYRTAPHEKNGISNFIHPLWVPDGSALTLDHPADHPHHRGIFWAWRRIAVDGKDVADSWVFNNFSYKVSEAEAEKVNDGLRLRAVVQWLSPNVQDEDGRQTPFVEERILITVHEKKGIFRTIDFSIGLQALREGVTIAGYDNESELSGFSIRMETPDDLVFRSPQGTLTPRWPAMQAGPWVDISGSPGKGGKTAGITIMSHPDNPPPHGLWNLRQKDSMQNIVFPGREPFTLPLHEPLILKYRLVVHEGIACAAPPDSLYQNFAR